MDIKLFIIMAVGIPTASILFLKTGEKIVEIICKEILKKL